MAKKKERLKQITTPPGKASYPYLTRPDTKFDPDGDYKVNLILAADEAEKLMAEIDEALEESYQKAIQDNPTKAKKIKKANPPYSEVTDDEGNETGEIQFVFKSKAKITPRNGGEPFEIRPALFDAKGQALPRSVNIGGGSLIKVCGELSPYHTDLVGAGVSLRLKAVQVLELVEFNGQSADRYGFDVEDGFEFTGGQNEPDEAELDDEAEADF
jgi:hypothetical protein